MENQSKNAIAFVDVTVPDFQSLIAGIAAGTEIVILDPNRDGIEQISEILGDRSSIQSLHIISHGSAGSVQLGSTRLSANNLQAYASALQQWGASFTENADILLYGCNVAADPSLPPSPTLPLLPSFIQQLSELTGADVAASDDLTGSAAKGGDWDLEAATGDIETPLAIDREVREAYDSVLPTIDVTTTADEDNGTLGGGAGVSLREAIRYSAAGDTINLPAGTYTLSIAAINEDAGATGDLDITKNLTITGAGAGATVINTAGGWSDRVFHVTAGGLTVNIAGVTVSGGNITDFGGGIYNESTLTVANSAIAGNTASDGGGIYNNGTLTVTSSTVSGNTASNGGGISNNIAYTLDITDTTISNNTATFDGGGINNGGTATVTSSTISGNSASNWAGGIRNDGTLTFSNSTLSGNRGDQFGGIRNGGNLLLRSSTIAFNSTPTGGGGGVWNTNIATVVNTLIAQNTALFNPDVDGIFTSSGNNLIGDGTGGTGFANGVSGDIVGTAGTPIDPLLGILQNNGGATATHALLPGSAAIDAGNGASAPATDQRGQARGIDGNGDGIAAADIGAVEARANTFPTAAADAAATTPGTAVKINALANDADAENDYLNIVAIVTPPTSGTVAIDDDVYAGGNFTTAGGVPANYVAKWDGTAWTPLGAGMNSSVTALAFSGGKLYAGGTFTSPGSYIAQWDGSTWAPLGAGVDGNVNAIAVSGSNVYAGGFFFNAGGASANFIARWDGTSWAALGAGTDATIDAIALNGANLIAGGGFSFAGSQIANSIAQWNGASWAALGTGMNSGVEAIATANNNIYAGGNFTTAGGAGASRIAQWNGASWAALGTGMNNTVRSLLPVGSNLYAGGLFTTAGGTAANYIAQWNGASWLPVGGGVNLSVFAIAPGSANSLYAGGIFTAAGGVPANRIAKWNGTTWTPLGTGMDLDVTAIAVDPGRSLTYTPTPGFNGVDTFTYRIADNNGGNAFNTVSVIVNNSPVLDSSGNPVLGNVTFNDPNNPGTLISDLIATTAGISDANAGAQQGIAIVGADPANGTWQYTADGGTTWNAFPATSPNSALLLAADANTKIRFLPNANFVGTLPNAITFHAWDGITGTNGGTADVATDLINNGASSPFSSAFETASLTVTPLISIDDVTVTEGNSGTATLTFTVSLNGASGQPITVDYATADSTATAGVDYTPVSGTLTFNPTEITKTVTVDILGDFVDELNESFFVNLSNPSNATLADNQGIATITDDDTAGISITPTAGLTTTETGGTANFTVVLNSQPTADVAIGVSSSNPAEGNVSTPTLTFTPANWNAPQAVTVTGVDDFTDDGDIAYNIITSAASSADPSYNNFDVADVAVTNIDNEVAGISLTQPGGDTSVTEGGSTDTYTLVLTSAPTAPVTINFTTDSQIQAIAPITFDASNWNISQTVIVRAADDSLAEGNHTSTIAHTVTSTDPNYNNFALSNVAIAITDNDSAGVSIVPTGGSTDVTEGGNTDTYTVVLTTQPTAPVTVNFITDGQLNAISPITFDASNWNVAQTITVTAADDNLAEGTHTSTISHSVTSADTNYNAIAVNNELVTITDNDAPGVSIVESGSSTTVAEGGNTDTYTLVLTTQPTASVAIDFNTGSHINAIAPIVFDSTNWNLPQTVTVTATDDNLAEGNHASTITHTATSADANYSGIAIGDVLVDITDNDSAGVSISQTNNSTEVAEGGASDTYAIALTSAPSAPVTINFNTDGQVQGIPPIVFDSTNWNIPQTISVLAVNDAFAEGNRSSTIRHAATSADARYNGIAIADVVASVTDNDTAGISISPISTSATEGGAGGNYTIAMTSAPTSPVTINFTTDGQVETITPITFDETNWYAAQTITVTAVDDALAEGNQTSTIRHTVTSSDGNYNAFPLSEVTASITDNDSAGISIVPISTSATEGGANGSYSVVLTSAPKAPVTVNFTTDSQVQAISAITFDSTNWNLPQTVTVIAANDNLAEGNQTSVIAHSATSADADYNGIGINNVIASITDNDSPGISVAPTFTSTAEGGTPGSYSVVLTTAPRAAVTVNFSTDAQLQAIAPITFDSTNWNVAQTVAVKAVDDAIAEGNQASTITAAAASGDADYNGIGIVPVSVAISDNDAAGVPLTLPVGTIDLIEGFGEDIYKLALAKQPTAPVTIAIATDGQTTTDIQTLIFTPENWNIPQTVKIAAVDNAAFEGAKISTISFTAKSENSEYNNLAIASIPVTISDNDNTGTAIEFLTSANFAATDSDDIVSGSELGDNLNGRGGSDRIDGSSGDDIIYGDGGSDAISGGDGSDQLYGGAETDYINGNAGSDLIFAGSGSDRVRGGSGNDLIFGDGGNDFLFGDLGADTLTGGLGTDAFAIGAGTGGMTLETADAIADFTSGEDVINLIGSLSFEQLNIFQGTGANASDTVIQDATTSEYLAILQGISAGSVSQATFV